MYPLRVNNVLELHRQRDLIDLDPPYQRLSVWDYEKQRRFIDSVINGIDTPKIYFHDIESSGPYLPTISILGDRWKATVAGSLVVH